jgi:hypothetical protein
MTDTEIETHRKNLNNLTAKCTKEHPEENIYAEFFKLAKEVGASTRVFFVHPVAGHRTVEADTSELIRNIHQALQTASMANMCSAATKGYEIATNASNMAVKAIKSASIQFWIATGIAVISAIAAVISAMAAWVAAK